MQDLETGQNIRLHRGDRDKPKEADASRQGDLCAIKEQPSGAGKDRGGEVFDTEDLNSSCNQASQPVQVRGQNAWLGISRETA